jgi:hypothetical protein
MIVPNSLSKCCYFRFSLIAIARMAAKVRCEQPEEQSRRKGKRRFRSGAASKFSGGLRVVSSKQAARIMSFYYALITSGFVFLTATALLALRWAIKNGEFRNTSKAALLVFDEEEPVGKMTDFFPGKDVKAERRP